MRVLPLVHPRLLEAEVSDGAVRLQQVLFAPAQHGQLRVRPDPLSHPLHQRLGGAVGAQRRHEAHAVGRPQGGGDGHQRHAHALPRGAGDGGDRHARDQRKTQQPTAELGDGGHVHPASFHQRLQARRRGRQQPRAQGACRHRQHGHVRPQRRAHRASAQQRRQQRRGRHRQRRQHREDVDLALARAGAEEQQHHQRPAQQQRMAGVHAL